MFLFSKRLWNIKYIQFFLIYVFSNAILYFVGYFQYLPVLQVNTGKK